jgi:hypothetical protein
MNRPKRRGFVLGELALLLTGLTLFAAFERAVEPAFDRFCVGAGSATPNEEPSPRAVSDLRRWVCVAISNDEALENRYAHGAARSPRR